MVELFAANIRQFSSRAESLIPRLAPERQARVRALGDSDAALRSLAGGLLLLDAFGANARFVRDKGGKPRVPGERPFSLSHAGDYAVLALSGAPVGADVERVYPVDWRRLSARFFHPDEHIFLLNCQDPLSSFFEIWTLKESYLKAEGTGFARAPSGFCILPAGEGEDFARPAFDTPYRFRSFGAFEGYRLNVCFEEAEIAPAVTMQTF